MLADTDAEKRVLLWGNSHADHWSPLFSDLAYENNAAFYLNARNCRATLDSDFCGIEVQDAILKFVSSEGITDVVLASTSYGAYGLTDMGYEEGMAAIVQKLSERSVTTWLVIDVPRGEALSPVVAYTRNPINPKIGSIPSSEYMKTKAREQAFFESLSGTAKEVHIIDPSRNLCDSENCFGGNNDTVWYRDSNHVSDAGARAVKEQFSPVFTTRSGQMDATW